jgi:ribosomal protein L35AE/L33A
MISQKFKTIFVHIPKTGGQSVEMAYLREHGLDWAGREPLLLRRNDDPEKGPLLLAHLFARQYVEFGYSTPEEFSTFFKFAVVRHPFDRFVSYINYRRKKHANAPRKVLKSIKRKEWPRHFMAPQVEYVTDKDGKVIVDEIIKLENMQAGIEPIFQRTLGKIVPLQHENKSTDKRLTRQDLKPKLRRKLYKFYRADFEQFGYEP